MSHQTVIIIDCGAENNQLLARSIRNLNVYCEMLPCTAPIEKIKEKNPQGIILTGRQDFVCNTESALIDKAVFELNVPVLGIGCGCQIIARLFGGETVKSIVKEYGKHDIVYNENPLFEGVKKQGVCWINNNGFIQNTPYGFEVIAKTDTCQNAAFMNSLKKIYGVQFSPESQYTADGIKILKNFLFLICGAKGEWTMKNFVDNEIKSLREKIGGKKVLCALSGGVDSAVSAALIHKACPESLTCVFVDHGLMRKNEAKEVYDVFKNKMGMNLISIDAENRFLNKLKGVTDPETKRKIIGKEFINVFEEEAKKIGAVDFLVQGTIYPDVIESGIGGAVIKSHHNVGGLPDVIDFKEIIEPLRNLFKDEVRKVGFELGLPEYIVMRQPFPGPGLAVRCIGEITKEKLDILRDADFIVRDEIKKANLDKEIWQYFAILTNMRSVGIRNDSRSYDYTVALRAVLSIDAMTADWARIPYDVLEKISAKIVSEVKSVNRIVYDITTKPPATIEWE